MCACALETFQVLLLNVHQSSLRSSDCYHHCSKFTFVLLCMTEDVYKKNLRVILYLRPVFPNHSSSEGPIPNMPQKYSGNVCAASGSAGVISLHYQLFLSFVFLCKNGEVSQYIKNYSVGFTVEKKGWEMLMT